MADPVHGDVALRWWADAVVAERMLLAVDIGNTNTVFGLFVGDELRFDWEHVEALLRSEWDLARAHFESGANRDCLERSTIV